MFTTSLPTLVADSATVLTITSHKPTFTTTVPVYYCSNCTNYNAHVGWDVGPAPRAQEVLMWRPEWHHKPLIIGTDGGLTELATTFGGVEPSMILPCPGDGGPGPTTRNGMTPTPVAPTPPVPPFETDRGAAESAPGCHVLTTVTVEAPLGPEVRQSTLIRHIEEETK